MRTRSQGSPDVTAPASRGWSFRGRQLPLVATLTLNRARVSTSCISVYNIKYDSIYFLCDKEHKFAIFKSINQLNTDTKPATRTPIHRLCLCLIVNTNTAFGFNMWQFEDSEICSIGMIHPSHSRHSGLSLLSGMSTFSGNLCYNHVVLTYNGVPLSTYKPRFVWNMSKLRQ